MAASAATEFGRLLRGHVKRSPTSRRARRAGRSKRSAPLALLPPNAHWSPSLRRWTLPERTAGDEMRRVGLTFGTVALVSRPTEMLATGISGALDLYENGKAGSVPKELEMEIAVIRVGDVGIVGLPCEPFQGIGRIIRRDSPLPISIPCGYANVSHGYITDGPNTGDREYMSAFYRYTKYRPPLEKPAGDVLAERAVEILRRFAEEPANR